MKVLVILLVLVGFVTISYSISDVSAICMANEDWSDAPCFSEKRGNDPSLNQMRQSWMQYYDFKGKEWMESKKQELIEAVQNEKLLDWKMSDPKGANSNVYTYYFLMGDIPNENGLFADEYYGIKYLSPLKQKNSGVELNEIHCGINLILLQKYDGTPACVTESTKQKLIERGWTTKESDMKCDNNADFDLIRYSESEDIPPQRLVAFLKEGTTGVICLQYISNFYNEGFFDIDENLHQRNSSNEISSNVVLNAIPDKVSLEHGTNVTVAYEIHAKNNSTGIYWINLSQLCDSLPVVVWNDEPRVSEEDIPVRTGVKHCPAKVLDVNIIGYSGLDLQYHSAKPT